MNLKPATAADAIRAALEGAQREQLLGVVRRHGGTRLDAEEILQIALQRALERAEQLRDPARAKAWLGRLVRNVVIDELRKRKNVLLSVDDVQLDELALGAIAHKELDCSCVLVQVDRLKPEYARILRRVIIDGAPVTQIAAEIGIAPNNAMVRLHRARTALKERLAAHCGTTSLHECSECVCNERGCCPPSTQSIASGG